LGTKGYHTAVAAEPPCNNAGCDLLEGSATIRTSPASSAAPPLRLCRLNNKWDQLCLQNHSLHEKSTYNREVHPIATHLQNMC